MGGVLSPPRVKDMRNMKKERSVEGRNSSDIGRNSWSSKSERHDKHEKKRKSTREERKERHEAFTPTITPIPPRVSNIKYFKCLGKGHKASKCPNRHVMIVKEDVKIRSESSARGISASSESESLCDGSYYEGDLCLILGSLCYVIINGGSCINVANGRLLKKLAFPTTVHPRSYGLQWLSEKGDFLVDKQAKVTFSLGAYEDRVVCDRVVLKPLPPREVQED
ncbi:hypothetical protein CR513_12506, partial [Mucuna pruriens]